MTVITINEQLSTSDVEFIYGSQSSDYIGLLVSEMISQGAANTNQISYVLATTKHETLNYMVNPHY